MARRTEDWGLPTADATAATRARPRRRLIEGGRITTKNVGIHFRIDTYAGLKKFLSEVGVALEGKVDSRSIQPGPFLSAILEKVVHETIPEASAGARGQARKRMVDLFLAVKEGRFRIDWEDRG